MRGASGCLAGGGKVLGMEEATTCSRKAPGSDLGGSRPWTASSLSAQLPLQPSLGQGRTLLTQHVRRPHLPPSSTYTNKCSEEPMEPHSWAPGLSSLWGDWKQTLPLGGAQAPGNALQGSSQAPEEEAAEGEHAGWWAELPPTSRRQCWWKGVGPRDGGWDLGSGST